MEEIRKTWWERGNCLFAGFTNGEVVMVHAFIMGLLLLCGLAEGLSW